MKKAFKSLVISVLLLCTGQVLSAQWYLGGGMIGGYIGNGRSEIGLAPDIGYRFNPNISVGSTIGYTYRRSAGVGYHRFLFDPYIRARFSPYSGVYLYADAFGQYNSIRTGHGSDLVQTEVFKTGLRPGIGIPVSKRIFLMARLGYLGYSSLDGWGYHFTSSDIYLGFGVAL